MAETNQYYPSTVPELNGSDHIPTPSLISKEISSMFRLTLLILLVFDALSYFFGSFRRGTGDLGAVDLLLVFLGYYAQDILRAATLRLYIYLNAFSLLVDSLVILVVCLNGLTWSVIIGLLLYLMETTVKIASMYYARKLSRHLVAVPGQSINTV